MKKYYTICKFASDMKSYTVLYDNVPQEDADDLMQYAMENRNLYNELIFCFPSNTGIKDRDRAEKLAKKYTSNRSTNVVELFDLSNKLFIATIKVKRAFDEVVRHKVISAIDKNSAMNEITKYYNWQMKNTITSIESIEIISCYESSRQVGIVC